MENVDAGNLWNEWKMLAQGKSRKAYVDPCRREDNRGDLSIRARVGGRTLLWQESEKNWDPFSWGKIPQDPRIGIAIRHMLSYIVG